MKVKVKIIKTGYLEENSYVLIRENDVLVIDPGDDYNKIKKELSGYNVLGVLITHNHFDHVGALDELLNDYKVNCYDYSNLKEKEKRIGKFKFEVFYMPGHSKDSICFYFKDDKMLFSGDFIFKGTIGRCDLDGGSYFDMKKSLCKLNNFDMDTLIYPGHGECAILGEEISIYKSICENI